MDTASDPGPALVLLMMNSDWEPETVNYIKAPLDVLAGKKKKKILSLNFSRERACSFQIFSKDFDVMSTQ